MIDPFFVKYGDCFRLCDAAVRDESVFMFVRWQPTPTERFGWVGLRIYKGEPPWPMGDDQTLLGQWRQLTDTDQPHRPVWERVK